MKGFEKDCYLADLSDIPWDSAYICDDTDDIHDHWHHIFIKVVDQRFPFKKKYIGDDQLPWITLEIYFAISRGNIFFRKFEGNKSDDNWEQFKKQRNLVAPLKGLRNPISFRLLLNVPTPVNSGKKFKPLLPSKGTQQQHIQRLEEGWLITDNMEIANIFNKHFIDDVAAHVPILYAHANHLSLSKISQRFFEFKRNRGKSIIDWFFPRRWIKSVHRSAIESQRGICMRSCLFVLFCFVFIRRP